MIKIVVGSAKTFLFLKSIPVVRKFFVFDICNLEEIEDDVLRCAAISTISTSNDTMKTTFVGRFSDLNDFVFKFLNKKNTCVIHDVAISNGVTSVELYEYLLLKKLHFDMCISDKFSTFNVQGKCFCKICDSDFKPSFYYLMGIYFGPELSWRFFVSKYFYFFLKLFRFRKERKYKEISVFSKKIVELIDQCKITHIGYDIFESKIFTKFDFVRCMNVLNKAYFEDDLILRGVENIFLSLKNGGVLQIGRTDDCGVNNVSFYRRSGQKLELQKIVNSGSELHDLILLFNSQQR